MNVEGLAADLAALSDATKTTFQLINRLSKLNFQPRSAPLNEHGDVRLELAQDIRDNLKQHQDTLEALRQETDDVISSAASGAHRRRDSIKERERARIAAQVARLDEDLKHARSQFRKAQLTAKRASEAAKQKEREILFTSIQQSSDSPSGTSTQDLFAGRRQQPNKQLTQEELLVNASTDVTSALRRTHDLLTSELSRSRFAQETLDQSTTALADLGEKYGDLDTLLNSSKTLLGTLVRSQKSDTWYLETAFYILAATICWLLFRRLIYGPAWWFIWLPLKYLLFKPFLFIFTAFGIKTNSQSAARLETSVSRPPLRVHATAKGGHAKFAMNIESRGQRTPVPAGAGGSGAKIGKDGKRLGDGQPGTLSQKIGQMAEASRQAASGAYQQEDEAGSSEDQPKSEEVVRRGDGTILQERGDKPVNPRKKMWEEDVESAKLQARKRDEL